jgi:hypothetical protein
MDPYLERPSGWQGFHNLLIANLAQATGPRLRPRYFVAAEVRVYVEEATEALGQPDATVYEARQERQRNGSSIRESSASRGAGPIVLTATVPVPDEIQETYLEVREVGSRRVVTLIELLSPGNKRAGRGRQQYLAKRGRTLETDANLVEIDLLRAGERMPASLRDWPADTPPPGDYRILVARGNERPVATIHTFTVHDPIPTFRLPLTPRDDEPEVDLRQLIDALYDTMSYDLRIDYRQDPVPPLQADAAAWADALLRAAKLR